MHRFKGERDDHPHAARVMGSGAISCALTPALAERGAAGKPEPARLDHQPDRAAHLSRRKLNDKRRFIFRLFQPAVAIQPVPCKSHVTSGTNGGDA